MLVQAADVRFGYRRRSADGSRTHVLDGVSLRVSEGGLVGILGPNGSGKTTLLKLVSGALAPETGTMLLGGLPAHAIPRRDLARRLAVVPQDTHLAFDYTALEVVLMGRYPHLAAFEIEGPRDLEAATAAMAATATMAFAERAFMTLSGGEKQRVVIASALAQLDGADASALLLLDEPTASLDLRFQLEVADLLRRLHHDRHVTVMLTTHDLRFAASVCTEIVLLGRGRVLAQGPPRDVLRADMVGALYEIDPALVASLVPR